MTVEDEDYLKNNIFCRFCEKEIISDDVRDHCHLNGNYRGPANSKCNVNVTQKQTVFIPFFFITLVTMIVICSSRNRLLWWMIK